MKFCPRKKTALTHTNIKLIKSFTVYPFLIEVRLAISFINLIAVCVKVVNDRRFTWVELHYQFNRCRNNSILTFYDRTLLLYQLPLSDSLDSAQCLSIWLLLFYMNITPYLPSKLQHSYVFIISDFLSRRKLVLRKRSVLPSSDEIKLITY